MTSVRTAADAPTVQAGRGHLAALDGVRAVAALAVIATHAGYASGGSLREGPVPALISRLTFGVTLFFLLSGFLLYTPFVRAAAAGAPPPSTGRFYWRRLLRIAPAYWLAVAVTVTLLSTYPTTGRDWVSYLTLTQTYTGHYYDPNINQMWTLVVEVAFYAAVPMLAGLGRMLARRLTWITAQLWLLGGMSLAALAYDEILRVTRGPVSGAQLWLPAYLDWFALGMLLALAATIPLGRTRWRDALQQWANAPGTCWLGGALFLWLASTPLAGPRDLTPASAWEWLFQHYLFAAAAFFFLLPVVLGQPGWHTRILASRPVAGLGRISYGVYLWHLGLLLSLQRWLGWPTFGGHGLQLFLISALSSSVVAAGSWFLLERPLLRRFGAGWRRPTRVGTQPGQRDQA